MRHLRPACRTVGTFLLFTLGFGLIYTQRELYYSNQSDRMIWGAAKAGVGLLREDGLAQTPNLLPAFNSLVEVTFRCLHP